MLPFNNLKLLQEQLKDEINSAVQRVLDSGWYILGPEVEAFEAAFADYHGVKHAIAVANGTDAIELSLRAANIGAGDEVITVSHTALPTAYAIERAGATPIFVDIDPVTYTIDPAAAEAAITSKTKAIIPVHLYGQPADMTALTTIAQRHDLALIEDCAQAHGAKHNGQLVGTFGTVAAFSFYPTKNVGAYGDGGAILTDDTQLADRLRRLRNYGQTSRYISAEFGINSRLDDIQGAILQVKLKHLDEHNATRRELAATYSKNLPDDITPQARENTYHVYHLYVIRHPQRDALMAHLKANEIGTLIHYPVPVHLQEMYAGRGYKRGDLPVTEQAAAEILSLPMYVGLTTDDVTRVANTINAFIRQHA